MECGLTFPKDLSLTNLVVTDKLVACLGRFNSLGAGVIDASEIRIRGVPIDPMGPPDGPVA